MLVRSTTKYARISPKKARHVVREIQGLSVSDALDTLTYTPKKSAHLIGKTLKSAIANAENNHELSADELIVKEATVGEGPTLKRFKPRARGSAGAIRKRTSHIFITLTDEFEAPEEKKRSGKPCIRCLRITVYDVFEWLAAGMTQDEILEDYPELTLEDIQACFQFAADREKRLLIA